MVIARNLVNIALIGFIGAGKSSVGRLVADHLHYTCLDTDDVIVARAGKPITDIFAQEVKLLSAKRSEVLSKNSHCETTLISTGGGLPVSTANMASLKTHALVICLWASPETILDRVKGQTHRPLLNDPEPLAKIR